MSTEERHQYSAGPLTWTVDGDSVVVSDSNGVITTFLYHDSRTADEMAQRMARRELQSKNPYSKTERKLRRRELEEEGDPCNVCGEYFESGDLTEIADSAERLCPKCLDERIGKGDYFQCGLCGDYFWYESRAHGNEHACVTCAGEQSNPERESAKDANWEVEIVTGAKVFRRHPSDGSPQAGRPIGKQLTVMGIEDQRDQYNQVVQKDAIASLSDGTWEFRWNLLPDRKLSRWKHAATRVATVTQEDMDRMNALAAKMDRAAKAAGKTGTDTSDLTPDERREYRALREKFEEALDRDFEPSEFHGIGDEEHGNNPPDEDGFEDNPRRTGIESGRATRVWQDSAGNTHVRYHNTDVVSFNDRWITLRTGGRDTMTTRNRWKQAALQFGLGYRVARERGETIVTMGENGFSLAGRSTLSLGRDAAGASWEDEVEPTSDMPTRRRRPVQEGSTPTTRRPPTIRPRPAPRFADRAREEAAGQELWFEEGEWEETERNPPPEGTDVLVHEHPTLAVFLPLSGQSRDWWQKNVQQGQRWGSGYAVDPQSAGALIAGMQSAGLKVAVR